MKLRRRTDWKILKKAELYETYGGKIKKEDKKKKSKRSFPHSTAKHNVEGLGESHYEDGVDDDEKEWRLEALEENSVKVGGMCTALEGEAPDAVQGAQQ